MIETGGGRTKGWESLECLLSGAIADLFVTIALITADCSADGGMVGPLETNLSEVFTITEKALSYGLLLVESAYYRFHI